MTNPAPRTLAIDTSLATGGVAALDGDQVATRSFAEAREHARLLAAMLRDTAAELGWTPREVELVAVVRGPGSFTGLRVGITTAKAVAWAAAARLVAVSTFEVIAWQTAQSIGPHAGPIAIAIDAGRGEVFAAEARPSAASPTGWDVGPGGILAAEVWFETLPNGAILTGPALDRRSPAMLSPAGRSDLTIAIEAAWHPTAVAAGAVARLRAAAGEAHDPLTVGPDYLRPSYAEEKAVRGTDGEAAQGPG
jgi:tRNA threonylcarbamoyladenosine biosynthesis protein TsaB